MGSINSVSLPAGLTCRNDCACRDKCYAKKIERLRPTVRDAYKRNYEILKTNPNQYWREVEASVMMSRFFRFHVSGDIVDYDYFSKIVDIAERNKHCEILIFTKKYAIVNKYTHDMHKHGFSMPENLHVIYSVWDGLDVDNPYNYPEAHVRYRDGHTTASKFAIECGGNCTECASVCCGCWSLEKGQQVVFNEH